MEDYFDNIAIVNSSINRIVSDMFEFTDKNPDWRTQDTLIISRSGCKFIGDKLFHTDNCSCDDEYMESLE